MSAAGADIPAIRPAIPADTQAIAALHAQSWHVAYRGILSDAYLDGPMRAERQAEWRKRMARYDADRIVLVAADALGLAGFICLFTRHGEAPHSYIDNLHVAARRHGHGLGRALMTAAARALVERQANEPVSLSVFTANERACAFYEALGGRVAEHCLDIEADGRNLPTLRYVWDSPRALLAGTADQAAPA